MANEISISASLTASKGGASVSGSGSASLDMAGTEMAAIVQSMSTTGVVLNVGGCDTIQAILIKNLDAAISVTIGLTNGNPPTNVVSTIPAGKVVLLTNVGTLYGASASGTPDIFVVAVET
jgi:hypothetical protein